MRKSRQELFLHNGQCAACQYEYYNTCPSYEKCSDCPMYYKERDHQEGCGVILHHCHCLAPLTTEERKSDKCKFFKQKEVK